MGDLNNDDYVALTQKLLGAIVAHGDDGIKRDGMVGGIVDATAATDALVYCIAAVNLHASDCATPMGQRKLADDVRNDLRRLMKVMIEEGASPFASVERLPTRAN